MAAAIPPIAPNSSPLTSLPALTTIWTSPDACSTDWTYYKASGTYYTYITQQAGVTKDTPCRVPGWGTAQGTFSPGVCPYQWTTWKSQIISGSITSAMCCPSGYINQNSDCASLYSTTLSSITVFTEYEKPPTISEVPPGTAVMSAVYVLYQASDLSLLPTQQSAPVTSGTDSTSTGGGAAPSTASVTLDGGNGGNNGSNGSGLSTGAIAGIAVGSAVGALLLLVATVLVWRRARRRKAEAGDGYRGGGAAELHGEEHKAHEIDTADKPAEVDGTSPAVAMPANTAGQASPWTYYYDPNTGQWSGAMAAELPGDWQLHQHQNQGVDGAAADGLPRSTAAGITPQDRMQQGQNG